MTDQCKVSIILTTYNSEHCIGATLESLLNQTMTDFELIILDDCSTDNTVAQLKKYADPRIRLVVNEQNIGVSASRNKGLALAQGEYISPCDHDDISLPDKLQRQVDCLEAHPEVVLVSSQVTIFVKGEEYLHHQYDSPPSHLLHWMLFFRSPIVHSSICFRRSTLNDHNLRYNPNIKYADDYELYHLFAELGQLTMMPDKLVIKHEDGENASFSRMDEMNRNLQLLFNDRYEALLGRPVEPAEIERLQRICNTGEVAHYEAELLKLGAIIEEANVAFCDKYSPTEQQRRELVQAAADEWWRAVTHYAKVNRRPSSLSLYKQIPLFKEVHRPFVSRGREFFAAVLGPSVRSLAKRVLG